MLAFLTALFLALILLITTGSGFKLSYITEGIGVGDSVDGLKRGILLLLSITENGSFTTKLLFDLLSLRDDLITGCILLGILTRILLAPNIATLGRGGWF